MTSNEKTPIIKAATNEWFLLLLRILPAAGLAAVGWIISEGFHTQQTNFAELRADISSLDHRYMEDRITTVDRLGKVEGQVGEIRAAVDVHRSRLNDDDIDRRALWQRLFDMGRVTPQPKVIP